MTGDDKLQVLQHKRNLGYGGNQKAGYRYFIEKGFDIAVLLHGDGQYAPEILASVYHPLVTGEADAVFGSRTTKQYGGPRKGGMPTYEYLGNRVLTVFENRALGMRLTETAVAVKHYSMHALKELDFSKMTDDFHFDTEIIIKLHHQGFRIHEAPVPTDYGDEICYVNGMKYALRRRQSRPPLRSDPPLAPLPSRVSRVFRPLPRSRPAATPATNSLS